MEEKEIFKDIPFFEGIYQVSNFGRVKSCERFLSNGRFQEERIMKQQTNHKGYKTITFYKDGKNIHYSVHKLVALLFVPNPYKKEQVDHIDCDKTNNNFSNLRWCTNAENMMYAMENNLRHIFTPEESNCSRKVAKLDMNGNELAIYPSIGEAHRQNPKASVTKISAVCRGERHTTGGYRWEFRSDLPKHLENIDMKSKGLPIPIVQYDNSGNKIAEFKSISEANKVTKIHKTCIGKSLNSDYKTLDGCYFKYK